MIAILTVSLALVVFLVVGLPWALLLRRSRDDLADLVTDAAAVGLLVVVTDLALFSWAGAGAVAAGILVELVVVVFAVVQRRSLSGLRPRSRRDAVFLLAFVVILVAALVLRRHPSEFVEYTGDMGAYTNWALQFVRTGALSASWPPAFPMFLAFGGLLTGSVGVTAIVPVTGVALVAVTVRLLRQIGVYRAVALVIAAVIAVHPASIWYSRITLSESLNAPLLIVRVIAFVGAVQNAGPSGSRRRRLTWCVVGGLGLLALGLLRGTAPILLVPIVLLGLGALIVPRLRRRAPGIAEFLLGGVAATMVAYWYGIDRIPSYYVDLQLREILPGDLFRTLGEWGLFEVGPRSVALAIAIMGAATGVVAGVRHFGRLRAGSSLLDLPSTVHDGRRARNPAQSEVAGVRVRVVEALCGILLVVVVVQSIAQQTDVAEILRRLGAGLVVTALLAPFVVASIRHRLAVAAVVIFSSLSAAVFLELQISRLAHVRPHIVFLYWDRYLYSEVFPLLLVLVGVTLSTAFACAARRGRRRAAATLVALSAATTGMLVGILPQTALIEQNTELLGAATIESALGASMHDHAQTVLWGATAPGEIEGSGFPNTWQAFGLPLTFRYGYPFDNAGRSTADGTLPDAVLTTADLARASEAAATRSVYVVESLVPGGRPLADRIDVTAFEVRRIATIRQDVVHLAQPAVAGWRMVAFAFAVYEVTVSEVAPAEGS